MEQNKLAAMTQCCIWLIKHLCIDTEATNSSVVQNITKDGVFIGRYKISIERVADDYNLPE